MLSKKPTRGVLDVRYFGTGSEKPQLWLMSYNGYFSTFPLFSGFMEWGIIQSLKIRTFWPFYTTSGDLLKGGGESVFKSYDECGNKVSSSSGVYFYEKSALEAAREDADEIIREVNS